LNATIRNRLAGGFNRYPRQVPLSTSNSVAWLPNAFEPSLDLALDSEPPGLDFGEPGPQLAKRIAEKLTERRHNLCMSSPQSLSMSCAAGCEDSIALYAFSRTLM
jgi:hypothetical protein